MDDHHHFSLKVVSFRISPKMKGKKESKQGIFCHNILVFFGEINIHILREKKLDLFFCHFETLLLVW
jgi:hypothetical protein